MSAGIILVAAWLFAGRALLLCMLATSRADRLTIAIPLAFGIGLILAPLWVACVALMEPAGGSYLWVLWGVVVMDVVLLLLIGRQMRLRHRIWCTDWLWVAGFAGLCMLLVWFNGPLIEHLSDAWWHMGNIADMRDTTGLELPFRSRAAGVFKSGTLAWVGVDFSSYRLQAVLSWMTGSSVLEAWYASTVVVTGLLAVSTLLLMNAVLDSRRAVVFGGLFWLVILGGMNAGFRLTGWPAGMGYVFLNLGLIAAYALWAHGIRHRGVLLLLVAMAGMALFHLAELYLLAVALGALFAAFALSSGRQGYQRLLFPVIMAAAVGLFYLAGESVGRPPSRSAIVPALVMILAVWGIRECLLQRATLWRVIGISLLAAGFCVAGISWPHLYELFVPAPTDGTSYYVDYIPKYLIGWGDKLVAIPKWEHQLRASLLWTGLLAPLIALWLAWRHPGPGNRWLLVLSLAPWLILLSPPLFSLIISPIPIHGGYRVQFLIPVSMVLGQGFSSALSGNRGLGGRGDGRPLRFLVICATLLAVSPDLLTRLGAWADRPWAINTNAGFHWHLLDARPVMRTHTSWRYQEDLQQIGQWSREQPPTAFLSDLVTSYYVAAESALYPAVRHRHHDRLGIRLKRRYHAFCDGEASTAALLQGIQRYNDDLPRRRYERVDYIVTNRDTLNYTAEIHGGACVGEIEHLQEGLRQIADVVIAGEYLTLWRLRPGQDD